MRNLRNIFVALAMVLAPSVALAANNPANIPAVNTIAAMKALGAASVQYQTIQVLGYNAAGDGGGGLFRWIVGSSATAEPCVTFAATGVVSGRWVRQMNGVPLSVIMCGAYNDDTNSAATKIAFQAATDYKQRVGSPDPNGVITIPAGTYDLGTADTWGVRTNGANWCPLFRGDGSGSTVVKYNPSVEGSAFLFNSNVGNCNGGGVENLRVTGNSNTIGCQFLSTNNGVCSIQTIGVKQVALLCSCSSGGFSENDAIQVLTGSTYTARIIEYRTNGGGTGSFRRSGLIDSFIEPPSASANALVLIGAGSQPYLIPVNWSVNNQTNGTVYLVDNQSANFVTTYGNWELETTGTGVTQLSKAGTISFAGNIGYLTGASAQIVFGNILFAPYSGSSGAASSFKNSYYVLENASSAVQYLTAGTGATTNVNAKFGSSGNTVYNLSIFNSSTYNWNGQVLLKADALGGCAASIVSGTLFFGGGAPTFGTSNAVVPCGLSVTVPDAVSASSTRIFGVVNIPGENN
jgi:hypothetical protein